MTVTAKALVQAHLAATSVTTEYTCSTLHAILDKMTLTNTDSSAHTASVYIVPSGSTAGSSNLIISSVSIAAGGTYTCPEMTTQILNGGDVVAVLASAAFIVVRLSGREIT